MGDTEIMKSPKFDRDDEKLTESQVIQFSDVPESVRRSQDTSDAPVSVIGESLHFKGELSAGEDLIIEGTVEGTINQGKCCLTLRPNGRIMANVNATVSVTVRKSGVVAGNIVAPTIAIEEGATFNGSIEMRNPSK